MKYLRSSPSQKLSICILIILGLLLLARTTAKGQGATDGKTPLALSPGAPSGSHALSGIDNVNLFNGNLNLQLSLLSIGGRGEAGYTVKLPIERKWRVGHFVDAYSQDHYYPDQNWWNDGEPGYGPGLMSGRKGGDVVQQCAYEPYDSFFYNTLTRLTFTAGDGTEYELRDAATNGRPAITPSPGFGCVPTEYNRGKIFVTADGSAATFISDQDILDDALVIDGGNSGVFHPSGDLMLRNGVRYRIDQGKVTWMRDRNGNRISFTYDGFSRVTTITDSLNRQVTVTYANLTTTFYDQISFKGTNGASRALKVWYADLSTVLRPGSGYSIQTYLQLFPQLNSASSSPYNPKVISEVELPNGRRYRVYYNPYGEAARIELPTVGAFEYDYAAGITGEMWWNYITGLWSESFSGVTGGTNIYRRVLEKRIYPNGSTLEGKTTFSRPESYNSGTISFENLGYVVVDQRDPSGTLLARSKHYFHGSPRLSFFTGATSYPGWKEGREHQTESFDANGTTVKHRQVVSFAQRAAVSWWTGPSDSAPPNDPRTTEITSTLVDTNQVSKQTFGYDDTVPFNNQNNVKEYDFGSGAAGALLRETRTTFITAANYTGTDVHLRNLASQVSVWDGGGVERARTTFEHDNYSTATHHAPLVSRSSVSGFDTAFSASYTTRGNVTGVTRYRLTNGTVTGSVSSYAQYDILGNTLRSIDARGYATDLAFADCFGGPNGNARLNSAPSELSSVGQASYAFVTGVTNSLAQTSYTQFDYYTSRAVDAEDINGIVSSAYSDSEPLDRPTKVIRAVSTAAQNQSIFAYDDPNRIVTTTSDRNTFNDPAPLKSQLLYDGLGRTTETRLYEGGSNYIATQTQYDALGRAFKTSNPFRPYLSETAVWTTTAFDALSRVSSVTTPDNAVMTTAYTGNAVTLTDQVGKLRRSITDALGRLTRVDEPDGSNNLGSISSPIQPTAYTYNVLDNLTGISQGVQTRTFVYDSLSRLTSATNPESGTITYGYDANGNLTSKIDARSITTTLSYDALNRVASKSYNDSPQTPSVSFFYDAQSLPGGAPTFDRGYSKGRLVAVTYGAGSSAGTYRGYDQMGRVIRQYQRIDSVNHLVEATYFASSAMQTQTYPAVPGAGDRRLVTYTNDSAGRLGSLNSSATSYAPAASLSTISYSANNGLKTETYGNGLIHTIDYNNRLQPTQIKLGTSGNPTSVVSLGYTYGTTNNNGNILTHSYSGAGLSYTQNFGYDSLNRLITSNENSGSNWSETNGYDRYGNRWVALGGGVQSLYFNTSNNRITGSSYDNAGNLLNDGSHSYTYDAENKIAKVDTISAYVYDGEGQRVRKLIGQNLRMVYGIGGELLAEYNGANGALLKEYIYGVTGLLATIEPTAVNSNGTRYITPDHLGSPRVVTNSAASVVNRHDYKPFGEELGAGVGGRTTGMGFPGSGNGIRQKFTAKERDSETGLDYFLARYYSSSQGRFTSPDEFTGGPVELYYFGIDASANPTFYADLRNPQSLNKYQYSYNNPVRYVDPDGHAPDQTPKCTCPTDQQIIETVKSAADKVADVTGITAAAEAIREYGPKAVRAFFESGAKSAAQQDLEDWSYFNRKAEDQGQNKSDEKREGKDFSPAEKKKIDSRDIGACQDCGRAVEGIQNKRGVPTPENQRQRHHVTPKVDGGEGRASNGVTLCPGCHKERHRQIREEKKKTEERIEAIKNRDRWKREK